MSWRSASRRLAGASCRSPLSDGWEGRSPRRHDAPSTRLSRREREAVLALRDGKTRAAVAKHLGISVYTLGTRCKRAYRKLGINRVSQLRDIAID